MKCFFSEKYKWYVKICITVRFLNNMVEKLEKFEKSAQFCNEFSESRRQRALWSGKSFFYMSTHCRMEVIHGVIVKEEGGRSHG